MRALLASCFGVDVRGSVQGPGLRGAGALLACLLVKGLSRDDRHMVVARTRGPGDAGIDWLPGELPCCPDPQERWPRGPTQKSQTTEIFALAAV